MPDPVRHRDGHLKSRPWPMLSRARLARAGSLNDGRAAPFVTAPAESHCQHGHPRLVVASFVITVVTFSVAGLPIAVAGAAADTVTTCSGTGPGSLPAVVGSAASGDTISFSVSCPPSSPIVLSSAVDITASLTIEGPGANNLAVSGNNAGSVFVVESGVTGAVNGLTIEEGNGGGSSDGGGIEDLQGGTLSVSDTTFLHNSGPGIEDRQGGNLSVTDSTFSANSGVESTSAAARRAAPT